MRYITTTYPVMVGGSGMAKGHYAPGHMTGWGMIVGYENNVPVPCPGKVPPKPGHWRLSPGSKQKAFRKSCAVQAGPYMPANVQGVATDIRSIKRMPRKQIRLLIACGVLPPTAMPSRGGRRK